MRSIRLVLLTSAVVMLAGCDMFGEEIADRIDVLAPPDRIEMHMFAAPRAVYLPGIFLHNRNEPLDFLARSESDIVDLRVHGDTLSITPREAGDATIRVEGWDQDGTRSGFDFDVHVACHPLTPEEGMRLYFSAQEGEQWQYDLSTYYANRESYYQWQTTLNGEMTWKVSRLDCLRDTIAVFIDESVTGTAVTRQLYPENVEEVRTDTSWASTIRATISRDGVVIPGYTHDIQEKWTTCRGIGPTNSLDVDWQYPTSSPHRVTVEELFLAGFGSLVQGSIYLRQSDGLVRWAISCSRRLENYGASITR